MIATLVIVVASQPDAMVTVLVTSSSVPVVPPSEIVKESWFAPEACVPSTLQTVPLAPISDTCRVLSLHAKSLIPETTTVVASNLEVEVLYSWFTVVVKAASHELVLARP